MRKFWRLSVVTIDYVSDSFGAIAAIFILFIAFSVFVEVIMRYIFNAPTSWVLEISTYLLLALGFFAAAYTLKEEGHIRVDVVTSRLSVRTSRALGNFTNVLCIPLCAVITYLCARIVWQSIAFNEVSEILHIPIFLPKLALPVGAGLLTLQFIRYTVNKWHSPTGIDKEIPSSQSAIREFVDKPLVVLFVFVGLLVVGISLVLAGETYPLIGTVLLLSTFLMSGMPVFLALALSGITFLLVLLGPIGLMHVPMAVYQSLVVWELSAIPLFIVGAFLMAREGLTESLVAWTEKLLSGLHGGLGMATILSCAIFAAITGSSTACAATIALVVLGPLMTRGYSSSFSCGMVAAGGTLGILIPPSIPFIVYGAITEQSVGKLFIAGVIPGLMLTAMFMIYIFFACRRDPRYKSEPVSIKERLLSIKDAGPALFAPVMILGGIYTGIFTPTESAAVLVIYGIIVNFFYEKVKSESSVTLMSRLKNPLISSFLSAKHGAKTTSMLFMIIACAMILGCALMLMQVPQQAITFVTSIDVPPFVIIIGINILLIILGMFLEAASITVITIPILFPIIVALGYDPIWFGVMFVINMELAMVTPPVGINLYTLQGIAGVKLEEVIRGALPFVFLLVLGLVVVGLFPQIATWLPDQMMGK